MHSCDHDQQLLAPVSARLLADAGVQPSSLRLLSPPGVGRKSQRVAWRALDSDGMPVKVRCLATEAEAEALARYRRLTPAGYLPLRARHGSLLVESWVPGVTLTPDAAAARAEEIGALLGSLHVVQFASAHAAAETAAHTAQVSVDLDRLQATGVVATGAVAALRDAVHELDPGSAPTVLTHRDFCPENVVVDQSGHLTVVDNEWLEPGPAGADLGRTFARWAMSADVWRRFLHGYEGAAPPVPALRYWVRVMAVRSLVIRIDQGAARRAAPLAHLLALASARG